MLAMVLTAVAFEQWLRARPGFSGASVLALDPFDGGVSNLTCRAHLAAGPVPAVVLRVQREAGIFAPYDVIREGEVLRRLAASEVPVPAILAVEPDPRPLGAPFIVMEWVDAPHMGAAGPDADFGAYVRTVAAIHRLDWRGLGLDFLGVAESAAAASRA